MSSSRVLSIDPKTEIVGNVVKRNADRRVMEYPASQVKFFHTLIAFVSCIRCSGNHFKFGQTIKNNIPVVFKKHERDAEALYEVLIGNLPIRIPINEDPLVDGVKWALSVIPRTPGFRKILSLLPQTMVDCLFTDLKIRIAQESFCLNCHFLHSNGVGFLFESLLRTMMYHLVLYARQNVLYDYVPVEILQLPMEVKIKRIWFGSACDSLCLICDLKSGILLERLCHVRAEQNLVQPLITRSPINLNIMPLRFIDKVSSFRLYIKCKCFGGGIRVKNCSKLLFQKCSSPTTGSKHEFKRSIVFADNIRPVSDEEDPFWFWSNYGLRDAAEIDFLEFLSPLREIPCKVCNETLTISRVEVPETTWLFNVDFPLNMRQESLMNLTHLESFQLGGVLIKLAFVYVLDIKDNIFTSMHYLDKKWYYFDDRVGGLIKQFNPFKTNYVKRRNIRAVYYRVVENSPHRCLTMSESREKEISTRLAQSSQKS